MSTPAEQVPAEVAETNKKAPQLQIAHFKQAEHIRNLWSVQCETYVHMEQLLDETFWAHVAYMLRTGDRIEVMPVDNSFFAEFIVLATGKLHAQVECLRFCELDSPSPQVSDEADYTIDWGGNIDKYRIMRGHDVLSKGHDSQKAARRWRDSHIEALKR